MGYEYNEIELKLTHDMYENTWKCGEINQVLFCPVRSRMYRKTLIRFCAGRCYLPSYLCGG